MTIRPFQPGDEAAQAAVYNAAAAALPKFKPATAEEIGHRTRALGFDPATRYYAEDQGQVVGYAMYSPNGRVSFPWCLPGHEAQAEPLFQAVMQAMQDGGRKTAFAAYRGDWPEQGAFFEAHGFRRAREMLNFMLEWKDLPTPAVRIAVRLEPLRPSDLPSLLQMMPGVLRIEDPAELEQYFFHNPYFGPQAVSVIRGRGELRPVAVLMLIANPAYANPKQVDSAMPCYRLGAFGTEGMSAKRIHGLFSFLARSDAELGRLGVDLLGLAAGRLQAAGADCIAAQVPSDAPALLRFYQQHFRRQGSFPVWERKL